MELHQLGLPKEHSNAICKVYSKDQNQLQLQLKEHHLMKSVETPALHFTCKKDLVFCHVKRYLFRISFRLCTDLGSLIGNFDYGYSTVWKSSNFPAARHSDFT